MKKGDVVWVRMQRPLIAGGELDESVLVGNVMRYDESQECIYISLQSEKLEGVSLDAIYLCRIKSENESIGCTGRIQERFYGKEGKILKIQIENGFYKINIKYVDKQNT